MSKIFTVLALTLTVCWPAAALAASDVPTRGMSKAQVRAQFGEPQRARPAVGQPPISRWDYDGFSVYFENDTTLHSVREEDRAPAVEGDDANQSPASGEEPPVEEEEQETHIEVESFEPPANKGDDDDKKEDDEASTESESAPSSTGVRAEADGSEESANENVNRRSEDGVKDDADQDPDDSTDKQPENSGAGEGRFRFDPATGRIVVSEDDSETGSGDQ